MSFPGPSKRQRVDNNQTRPQERPTAIPAFDPRTLLRGQRKNDADDSNSAGNMLLSFHGVTNRQAPLKRHYVKEDVSQNQNRSTFRGTAGESMLKIPKIADSPADEFTMNAGAAFRQDAGTRANGKSPVVDLTLDDEEQEEEEVIYNGSISKDREICYGMLTKISASLHCIPDVPPMASASTVSNVMWPRIPVKLKRGPQNTKIIQLYSPAMRCVGTLSTTPARTMSIVMDSQLARLQAVILPRVRRSEMIHQPTSQPVEMTITLYGRESKSKLVATLLGQNNMFLNDPVLPEPGIPYKNPQYEDKDPAARKGASSTAAVRTQYTVRTTEEVKNEITAVLDSLEKEQILEETEPAAEVMTNLLSHQKQGLSFMLKKEQAWDLENEQSNSSLWRLKPTAGGSKKYTNVITGEDSKSKPAEARGGILADEMGLGKTLTVLSLIVSTLDEAAEHGEKRHDDKKDEHDPSEVFSRATLLVCPLSVLMNWEEQIKTHIAPETLSCYVYHGNSRISNLVKLSKYDVIITTYALVASDFNRELKSNQSSVLRKLNYFRIVLDEAHTIREAATVQSKAVCSLEASRKWAVTGTPIQNRLDDLATLIKFLRIHPFDSRHSFNQYIAAPLKTGDPTSMDRLRALVDSVALRRKKDKINLPLKHDNTVYLSFSKSEQELYDATLRQSNYKMNMVVKGGHINGRAYVHILQTILRLRMICASRDLLGSDDTAGLISSNAIDIDSISDDQLHSLSINQAFDFYNLMKESDEDICFSCEKKVIPNQREVSPLEDREKTDHFGYMTSCPHLFCTDCGPKYMKAYADQNHKPGDWVKCVLCQQQLQLGIRELKRSEDPTLAKDDKSRRRVTLRNPSTKILALIQDMLDNREKADEKGPIKSVIFSGWTMHLDLIEEAFSNAGIISRRIDGKMTRPQRTEAMTSFRENPEVEAIVISINAGGVGLNLTAASKVYVMEPQFNPAAEAQAIDRVHRLGQEREVYCTRYIMQSSFEEKIVALQKKKQKIADLSMTQGKSRKQQAQDKIDELKDLFR